MKRTGEKSEARRAIVMGATSGIGREVALCLAREGWLVGIAGRRKETVGQPDGGRTRHHGKQNGGCE